MKERNSDSIFNFIAPIYGLFYPWQKRRFVRIIDFAKDAFDLTACQSVLDVGCGTGALASVLHAKGLRVVGVDSAQKMLAFAKRQPENKSIHFVQASVLEKLPFADRCFDVSIASYVAHGMGAEDRLRMYREMNRVSRLAVIIHDYNENRFLFTSFVEKLEGGDYFRFIREAKTEMERYFADVTIIPVSPRASWYICTPH